MDKLEDRLETLEPDEPLIYVPSHTSRDLQKDLKRAGTPRGTEERKIDFHALRNTYITWLFETGATVKEAPGRTG